MNKEQLNLALAKISENPKWQAAFIKNILAMEKEIQTPGIDIREDITGPLVDSLFDDGQIVKKKLSNGIVLEFYYRSKIARDFIMSEPSHPDYAWEPQTTRLLVKLAKAAKNVLVGGAYFGDQVILIANEIAKSGGVVHAFEPNNDQRAMLMHNASLNSLTNILPRSEGLWDNSSSTLALVGYDSFAHPESVDESHKDAFQTVTINDYLKDKGVRSLDLIMLDIEGAELRALKGASDFLSQPAGQAPKIVFEVHRSYVDWTNGLDAAEPLQYLAGFGYHIFAVRDFNSNYDLSAKPIELIPPTSVFLEGPPHGFNMVAVKDMSLISGPEFSICEHVSPKLLRHKNPALHHPIGGL